MASGKANAAIEMRWNDLMDYNMPQDLHRVGSLLESQYMNILYHVAVAFPQEIEAQKAACATILVSKDKLIADFQLEIRAKDEEYVKSLQKQRDEIEELIARMTEQFSELRSSYEVELGHIEDSFLAVRSYFLSTIPRMLCVTPPSMRAGA